jgi:O-antigen/teichoic acid export membrane protein
MAPHSGALLLTFASGLVLARFLSSEDRGAVAVASIGLGLGTAIGTLGLAEYGLVNAGIVLARTRLGTRMLVWSLAVSGLTTTALAATGVLNRPEQLAAMLLALPLSMWNAHLLSRAQMCHGLRLVALCRLIHAFVGMSTLTAAALSHHLDRSTAVFCWAATELVLALFLRTRVQSDKLTDYEPLPATRKTLAGASGFALAQLGGMATDRGLIMVTAAQGGLSAAGAYTIVQNIAAPIVAPVQAFSTGILQAGHTSSAKQRAAIRPAVVLACLAALSALVALPLVAAPVLGQQYAYVGTFAALIACSGLLMALWRTRQLLLKAEGHPKSALTSDVAGLAMAVAYLNLFGASSGRSICLLGLTYAASGLLTAHTLRLVWRRSNRDAERGGRASTSVTRVLDPEALQGNATPASGTHRRP